MSLPFAEIFRPAYQRFCFREGTPSHVLIGLDELELLDEETRQDFYRVSDPSCTERKYQNVKIIITYDMKSVLHFFILK